MKHKLMIIGDTTFVADPDFHYGRTLEIAEDVTEIEVDSKEVKYLIKDEDLGYLLAACHVLQGFLKDLDNNNEEE